MAWSAAMNGCGRFDKARRGDSWCALVRSRRRMKAHRLFTALVVPWLVVSTALPAAMASRDQRMSPVSPAWTTAGPEGAKVLSLALDPVDSSVIYVGTEGAGVFKSRNAGKSWQRTDLPPGQEICWMAIDPLDS